MHLREARDIVGRVCVVTRLLLREIDMSLAINLAEETFDAHFQVNRYPSRLLPCHEEV